jgi:predicted metal-dependent peptidase
MKNYVLNSDKYGLLLEGKGGAGTTEAMLEIGGIKMPDNKVVDGSEFVKVVNSALAYFEAKYPFEYKFISTSPIVYLLDNSLCNTMCVDGRGVVYINVGFMYYKMPDGLDMDPMNVFKILYHECMHAFLDHIRRTHEYNKVSNENKLTWRDMNIAADLEINGMMVTDGVCKEQFWKTLKGCYDEKVTGLPMESIANNYKNIIDKFKQTASNIPQMGMPSQTEQGQQQSGQSDRNQQQSGDGQGKQDNQQGNNGRQDQNGKPSQNGQNGQDGSQGNDNQKGNGGQSGNDGQNGGDGNGGDGKKEPHEFDNTPGPGGNGGDKGQGAGSSGQDNSDGGSGEGNGGQPGNDGQNGGDENGGNKGQDAGSSGQDGSDGGSGEGNGGNGKNYNAEVTNIGNTKQRLVGEIIRQSEVDQKLKESLRNSGFGEDVAKRVSDAVEGTPMKSEEELSELRNKIIKNRPKTVLGRICKDIKISQESVKYVWDEIVKKFLEYNTLFAGKKKKISNRKRVRWGDRRTIAHDMMTPYHPKGDAAPQNINILIDTSVSIDMKTTILFAQSVIGGCDTLEYSGILLLPFATKVDEENGVYFENEEAKNDKEAIENRIIEMAVNNKAGGGTRITPCADCIEKYSKTEPKSVWIVLTDGEFSDAKSLKRISNWSNRLLFVIYNHNIKKKMENELKWCADPELDAISKCYIELNEDIHNY